MVITKELEKLYPFLSHFIKIYYGKNAESDLHYLDEGEGDPVLCLHGNPTWSFFFRHLVRSLSKTHRVIVPDHLGCGLSGRPLDFSYRLADHIANIERLAEALQLERITLVVHDWGGAIGLGFAVKNLSRIRRLIICNSAAFLSNDIPKRIAILRSAFINDILIRRANLFSIGALYMASAKGLKPEIKRAYLFPYDTYDKRIGVASFVKDIPGHSTHPSYGTLQDIEKQMQFLRVPTLLLWGAKDFCFHLGFLKKWQNIFPHSETKVLPEAGHYLLEDEPVESVAAIVKFVMASV